MTTETSQTPRERPILVTLPTRPTPSPYPAQAVRPETRRTTARPAARVASDLVTPTQLPVIPRHPVALAELERHPLGDLTGEALAQRGGVGALGRVAGGE